MEKSNDEAVQDAVESIVNHDHVIDPSYYRWVMREAQKVMEREFEVAQREYALEQREKQVERKRGAKKRG